MLPKKTQALSLEGLKRVAKELRDLVEKPEDGIWVSCSRREGKACRFENREEREKLLFNSRPRFSSAAAVADNKLSLSQPLLPLFLQKKTKKVVVNEANIGDIQAIYDGPGEFLVIGGLNPEQKRTEKRKDFLSHHPPLSFSLL